MDLGPEEDKEEPDKQSDSSYKIQLNLDYDDQEEQPEKDNDEDDHVGGHISIPIHDYDDTEGAQPKGKILSIRILTVNMTHEKTNCNW